MKKTMFIFVVVIGIFFTACDKDTNEISNQLENINLENLYEDTEYNLDMKSFAMAVNEAVNTNKSFRKLIKEEALKKFDGDYDVLLSNIVDVQIDQEEIDNTISSSAKVRPALPTVRELLENTFSKLENNVKEEDEKSNKSTDIRQRANASGRSVIDELMAQYPDLQVSVPVHVENLDDENYIPIVTFLPEEYNGLITTHVEAFEGDKNITLSAFDIPEKAVIVIGENERRREPIIDLLYGVPVLTINKQSDGLLLSWTISMGAEPVKEYKVYRAIGSGSLEYLINRLGYNTFYLDSNVEAEKTYSYRVAAIYEDDTEVMSELVYATGPNPPNSAIEPLTFNAEMKTNTYVDLSWALDGSKFTEKTNLYKQHIGIPQYNLIRAFSSTEKQFFDTNIQKGEKIKYMLQNVTYNEVSNAKYDFVYVPYRDPIRPSSVRIKHIIWKDSYSLEGPFLQGAPEFTVKVMKTNKTDKKTYEIQDEIWINIPTIYRELGKSDMACDIKIFDWEQDESWYDMLTFYVKESDGGGSTSMNFTAKYNIKNKELAKLGIEGGVEASLSIVKKGDIVGYSYLNYYDPIDYWVEFPNHGVKLLIGQ